MQSRGILEGTEVFVTTDHGFDGNVHTNPLAESNMRTWFASRNKNLTGPAVILDVTPTMLDALGIDISTANPPYRGVSRLVHSTTALIAPTTTLP